MTQEIITFSKFGDDIELNINATPSETVTAISLLVRALKEKLVDSGEMSLEDFVDTLAYVIADEVTNE